MKLSEYVERTKKEGWDDEAEKEWRELQEDAEKWNKMMQILNAEPIIYQVIKENERLTELEERLKKWVKEDFLSDGAIAELRDVGLDIGDKKLIGEENA